MFKKLLLGFFGVILLNNITHSEYSLLSELNLTLHQLQFVNSKFITPSNAKDVTKPALPNAAFYNELEDAVKQAFNGNSRLLDAYVNNQSAEVAKYMLSISNKLEVNGERPSYILLLVQLFDRIQAKYKVTDNIIITSVATGNAVKEKILLKTLAHFGYKSIKFYAIDPVESTISAIENFKKDTDFDGYNFRQFNDTNDFIKEIIDEKHEIPDACLTFYPSFSVDSTRNSYNLQTQNFCSNRSKNQLLTIMLILPNYNNEISIATSDFTIIQKTNEFLSKFPDIKFMDIKEKLVSTFSNPYICAQNIVLNFLEIIKRASSIDNDCIAYYKGESINTYNNIASKSIAQLYLEASNIQRYYRNVFKFNSNDLKIWTYNLQTNQFDQKK